MEYTRRIAVMLVIVAGLTTACLAVKSTPGARPRFSQQEAIADPTSEAKSASSSAFAPIRQSGEQGACGSFLPPRLVTVGAHLAGDSVFTVDVVIGTDGTVEDVLILDGAKTGAGTRVADRISRWVYKPALCNGVPVASEGRVEVRGE